MTALHRKNLGVQFRIGIQVYRFASFSLQLLKIILTLIYQELILLHSVNDCKSVWYEDDVMLLMTVMKTEDCFVVALEVI